MNDDNKYERYANIPIPSYDEATSSRPTSSQNLRGPEETSDDAERQGLLGQGHDRYRPPTVESTRSSVDSDDDLRLPEVNGDDARRQVEELDYLDPSTPDTSRRSPRLYHRARLRSKWSQQLSNLSATLSSIRLPSLRSLYTPISSGSTRTTSPSTSTWLTRMSQRVHIPDQYRLSAPTAARLCGLFTLMALIYVLFALDIFPGNTRRLGGAHFDPESVRSFVQENLDAEHIESFLAHITSFDHVAGTEGDLYLAKWMQEAWTEDGTLDSISLLPYYVYLNYPGDRSVSIVAPDDKKWVAKLEEEQVYLSRQQTLAWHGYSKSGEVEGHLIYANGGSKDDFAYLQDQGVVTNGSIALVKYGGTQGDRALKIKAAEEAGCAGVLIYSDPSDVPPDSAWQPSEDLLQRGGVSMMSYVVGDPLTPGFASTLDANRVSKDGNPGLPKIPSLPLSWRDAKVLLLSLSGHGASVPSSWVHGPRGFTKDWYTGNALSAADQDVPIVHLQNQNEENALQHIWNLHGIIEGLEEPGKKVIVGNHRDSWCFGAVDPGSGSAVLMEVVRIFSELRKLGWRPLRTIEFVSWDAEEYNLVGSTEYVEDNVDYLRDHGVAYLNVDVGVFGQTFRAAGSPVWHRALLHVLKRISDPAGNATLMELWDQHGSQLEGLGAGSDYVAFQDIAGTSSIDFGFGNVGRSVDGADQDFYPYHSCYETREWMTTYGDPGMQYHRTLAQVWALLILEIADRPLLPYDLKVYAEKIHDYIGTLEREAAGIYAKLSGLPRASAGELHAATNFTLQPLKDAADVLATYVEQFHRFEDVWTSQVLGSGGLESTQFALRRLAYNDRLAHFETDLLDLEGVPGREQFKHVIFGPQAWSGYVVGYFPAVRDAVEVGNWTGALTMVERAAERIIEAGRALVA